MEPHMLALTISKSFVDRRPPHLENFLRLCFPSKQLVHEKIGDFI